MSAMKYYWKLEIGEGGLPSRLLVLCFETQCRSHSSKSIKSITVTVTCCIVVSDGLIPCHLWYLSLESEVIRLLCLSEYLRCIGS